MSQFSFPKFTGKVRELSPRRFHLSRFITGQIIYVTSTQECGCSFQNMKDGWLVGLSMNCRERQIKTSHGNITVYTQKLHILFGSSNWLVRSVWQPLWENSSIKNIQCHDILKHPIPTNQHPTIQIKRKHEVSDTRLQINLNKELQNAPREALQIYIHKKKLRNHTQLSSQVIQQWGNMEKHNKEHYLKPIWSDKPGFYQDETQDQLHNPCASKAVFAQEGPYLMFVEEIIQYCMIITARLQI